MIECRLCKGNHFQRDCPEWNKVQAFLERERAGKTMESAKTSVPTSVPNEPNAAFKRNGTAALAEQSDTAQPADASPILVVDLAMPAMSEDSIPGTSRMQLFLCWKQCRLCRCGFWRIPVLFVI